MRAYKISTSYPYTGRTRQKVKNVFWTVQAYEILGSSRIPIHNIAEVLLLLREGGLVLRGEERNIVQRGAFRSAVLQKILVVLSHGVAELIRKS